MLPLRITIRNFLSYGDIPQEINFEGYSFICLSGPNGNGKTALLESIMWAIWGFARKNQGVSKNDESLIRIGANFVFVSLEFLINNKKYLIKRSCEKKGKRINSELSFFISSNIYSKNNEENLTNEEWNNLTLAHQKDTQELINSVVSLDYDTFINTAFLRQGFSNEFSRKTPKERKDILGKIIGIDKIDKIREKILEEIRQKESRIEFCNHVKNSLDFKLTKETLEAIKNDLLSRKESYLKKKENLKIFKENFLKVENEGLKILNTMNEINDNEKNLINEIGNIKNIFFKKYSKYKEIKNILIENLKINEKINKINFFKNKNIDEIEKLILNIKEEKISKENDINSIRNKFEIKNKKITNEHTENILKINKNLNNFENQIKSNNEEILKINNQIDFFNKNKNSCYLCESLIEFEKANEIFLKNENKIKTLNENNLHFLKKIKETGEELVNLESNKNKNEIIDKKNFNSKISDLESEIKQLLIDEGILFEIKNNLNLIIENRNKIKNENIKNIKNDLKEIIFNIKNTKKDLKIISLKKEATEIEKLKINENINFLKKEKEILENEIQLIYTSITEDYGKFISQEETYNETLKKKNEIEKEYNEIMQFYGIRSKLVNLLGKDNLQAALIEEVIPELEDEANKILHKLTDGKCSIFIESMRDLKSGKSKETLEIIIHDAYGMRPYEFFSGGESFRIDLSLRIALSKILAKRSGSSIRVFIIDEGFGSQDGMALEAIVQMLYSLQDDFDLIIIVSHLPFLKEEFPVHFIVNKGIEGSKVTIIE